ncbi:MAG: NlpC/P60 family protein [Capsulimonas sp.]|uniref:NlpC/P60 family protein n=1 Tax=Capsulimonas sp. TaxID=2494211 RepID=UPI0032633A55
MLTSERSLPILRPDFWRNFSARRRDWLGLCALLIVIFAFPIRTNIGRELTVALALIVWVGGLALFWRIKSARVAGIALVIFVLAVGLGPGRRSDARGLRGEYVRSLRSYLGTKYVWGGENRLGIDCSGLVRAGMIDASFRRGVATGNLALVRRSVGLWWTDASAARLGEGYGGRTALVCETESLRELDYSRLRPGDIAVTSGGAHTMAYLGSRQWIEADPSALVGDKVIQISPDGGRSAWLDVPMRILRWTDLE